MIFGVSPEEVRRWAASKQIMPGMSMSIRTMSGLTWGTILSASLASAAVPTTSKSACRDN